MPGEALGSSADASGHKSQPFPQGSVGQALVPAAPLRLQRRSLPCQADVGAVASRGCILRPARGRAATCGGAEAAAEGGCGALRRSALSAAGAGLPSPAARWAANAASICPVPPRGNASSSTSWAAGKGRGPRRGLAPLLRAPPCQPQAHKTRSCSDACQRPAASRARAQPALGCFTPPLPSS